MGTRRLLGLGLFAVVVTSCVLWACGADHLQAPVRARTGAASSDCGSAREIFPLFMRATRSGKTEGFRYVVETYLVRGTEDASFPAMNQVLRALFTTMSKLGAKPPETGAPEGQKCAEAPPPLEKAHPLCELRRSMDSLVHNGAGVQALALADPLIAAVLNYIIGREPSSATPHYAEVAPAIAGMCEQSAVCNMRDTLDLLIGVTAYARTPQGKAGMDRAEALVNHPALEPYIVDDANTYGGEDGVVGLATLLIRTVQAMDDVSDLNALDMSAFPPELRPSLELALSDLKTMLSPTLTPNILRPLQKVSSCLSLKDPNHELIRMFYRLGLEAPVPEFGLRNIVRIVRGLRDADERGSLLQLAQWFAEAVRQDDQAVTGAAQVCRAFFSTETEPGQLRSNAELALPVIADLFRDGVLSESVCAADTLLYGCAGGQRPACPEKVAPP